MEAATATTFDVEKYRKDFPVLNQQIQGKDLVYLDNGATSQKPQCVIDSIDNYYETENANVHRGVHNLSQLATEEYEASREAIRRYLNADKKEEIIFTKGATDSLNLLAHTFVKGFLSPGDEVIISTMEHHSNIVPWQIACEQFGAKLKVIPINQQGELLMEEYKKLLTPKTKIVSVTHVSNTLGTINPIKEIIKLAHEKNIPVAVDGAQAVPHLRVDLQGLDCDFYAFSSHKMFGPTGIGILYGKEKWLDNLPPYQGGGDMIKDVSFEKTTYNELPYKFEAGTPHICGAIGLKSTIEYLEKIDFDALNAHEHSLLDYATEKLKSIDDLTIYGEAKEKSALVSFNVKGIHHFDLGTILDQQGIAVRTGHHCTQPLMNFYNIPGTVRASFAFYNTKAEIDRLYEGIKKAVKMLK